MVKESKENEPERYWHIWIFLSENKNQFFYGFAAPSYHIPPSSFHKTPIGYDSIMEYHTAVTYEAFKSFQKELSNGYFSTNFLMDGFPNVNMGIRFHQKSIQNTLGCTAVPVDTYYSMSLDEYDVSRDGIKRMLGYLSSTNEFEEPNKYMHRLGAFDVISLPKHAEDNQYIVKFRIPKHQDVSKPHNRNTYEIWRREDFAQEQHWAHVCLYSGDTPVSDSLHLLDPGTQVFGPVTIDESFDRSEFRLFGPNGLLHHEDSVWLNQVALNMSVGQGTVEYTSPLTNRGIGVGAKDAVESLTHVSVRSRDRTNIVNISTGQEFRKYCKEMRERGKTLFQTPSPDRWFPKGVAGSLGALQHLQTLIEAQGVVKAWIVDPFFDAKAAEMFIPIIGVSNLDLFVITNLRNVEACREANGSNNETDPVNNLKEKLDTLRHIIHCNLTVKNLRATPGSNEQIFHDRYLCLKKQDDTIGVHLLSNSLNAYAENYPFCTSLLSNLAAEDVHEYICGLDNLTNPITGAALSCDLNWSK